MIQFLTLCLYVCRAFLALITRRFSSVSSLNDMTKAFGTHTDVTGTNILGTNWRVIDNGPPSDCILCSG